MPGLRKSRYNFLKHSKQRIVFVPMRLCLLFDEYQEIIDFMFYCAMRSFDILRSGKIPLNVFRFYAKLYFEDDEKLVDGYIDYYLKNPFFVRGFDKKKQLIYYKGLDDMINTYCMIKRVNFRDKIVSPEVPIYLYKFQPFFNKLRKIENKQEFINKFTQQLVFFYPRIKKKRKVTEQEIEDNPALEMFFSRLYYNAAYANFAIKEVLLEYGSEWDNFIVGNFFPHISHYRIKTMNYFMNIKDILSKDYCKIVRTLDKFFLGYVLIPHRSLTRYSVLFSIRSGGNRVSGHRIIKRQIERNRFVNYHIFFHSEGNIIYVLSVRDSEWQEKKRKKQLWELVTDDYIDNLVKVYISPFKCREKIKDKKIYNDYFKKYYKQFRKYKLLNSN